MAKKIIRLTESDLHNIIRESVNQVLSELDRSTMQNAYDKMKKQGRHAQAEVLNNTFNDMYNGIDKEGNYVNQTDLSGRGRHYFLNRSNPGESTISNRYSTYGSETPDYNPNIANSYLGQKDDNLAKKAQQIQDWQYGKQGSTPYRTDSNMTPSYMTQDANNRRNQERMSRVGR